ncbi:MAG TPA: M23 family metallopeptidase [Spirochaetota bacterium]|nr:M23 family metallopeptidase [Spirochaetota bacterium]
MKCRNFILKIVAFTAFLLLLAPGRAGAAGDPVETVELDLENSLIIREIEMESESGEDVSRNGKISVEEPFDAEYVDLEAGRQRSRTAAKESRPEDFMNDLRSRDPRWHLSPYRIRRGDNLWRIARMFDVGHRLIIRANGISDPDMLVPGMVIKVPNRNGVEHPIKKGDSIYALSKRYRVPAEKIINHNRVNPRSLSIGGTLFIPDAEAPKIASKRSAAKRESAPCAVHEGMAFGWPLRGKITSGFGTRKDPFSGKRKFHCGIDISAEEGTPIKAAAAGTVIFSDWKNGYGKVIVIRHDNGYISVYAHNSSNEVQKGDQVKSGDIVALSGSTGAVTGAHLHFEIRKYVTPLNPTRFLH